jgi:dTDP-4-dehydrorhamnose 3,5-epimerase-like enzyme
LKIKPYIFQLPKIGEKGLGFISLIEGSNLLPFSPKRIYWIYDVLNGTDRGGHYHHELQQIIICINGKLTVKLESNKGEITKFILDTPSKALYIPSKYWRDITFEENAVLLCIASENYIENDYVRSYKEFKNIS